MSVLSFLCHSGLFNSCSTISFSTDNARCSSLICLLVLIIGNIFVAFSISAIISCTGMFSVAILQSIPLDNTSINYSCISTVDRFFIVFSLRTLISCSDKLFICGLDLLISFWYFLSKVFKFHSTLDFIFFSVNITSLQ